MKLLKLETEIIERLGAVNNVEITRSAGQNIVCFNIKGTRFALERVEEIANEIEAREGLMSSSFNLKFTNYFQICVNKKR